MKLFKMRFLLPLAALLMGAPGLHAGLVVDMIGGGTVIPCGSCGPAGATVGWGFHVNAPITVDGLGVWDVLPAGLGAPEIPVGLFAADGTLLKGVTITGASTEVGSAMPGGGWLFEYFAPITLTTGDYLIGSLFYSLGPTAVVDPSYLAMPEIQVTGGAVGKLGEGFGAPRNPFPALVFGATLSGTSGAEVPEPATVVLLGAGLGALVLLRRRG